MKKTQVIKTFVFIIIFVILFVWVTDILRAKWVTGTSVTTVHEQMYEQKKDSVDVLVLGSSQLVYGISSMRLLEEYGISAFSCATGEQPVLCAYFYLKEMEKKQDIKTVIYDMSMLYEEEQEARFRKTLDSSPISINKLQTILEHRKSGIAESTWTYVFPIMKYHSRWDELTKKDYDYKGLNTEVFKGNIMSPEVAHKVSYDKVIVDNDEIDDSIQMDEAEVKYFREMVQYCEDQGIDLVLIKTPKLTWNKTCMLGAQALADEYGLEYMDFNREELLTASGIDVATDFWNGDHLNIRGAEKLTDYLADYLLEHYEFEDGRKTDAYDPEEVKLYQIDREDKYVQTSYDVSELLELLNNDRYELLVSASGDISAYWTDENQKAWEQLGAAVDLKKLGTDNYAAYLHAGENVYEETQQEVISYAGTLGCGAGFTLESNQKMNSSDVKLEINGKTIEYQNKGLNICVFDSTNKNLVDSFTIGCDEEQGGFVVFRNKAEVVVVD